LSFFNVNELLAIEMLPGIFRKAVWLDGVMMTFFEMEPQSEIPAHDHPNEQITYILAGELEITVGSETRVLRAGDGVCVPSGTRHGARVLNEKVIAVDGWNPVRDEYKGDQPI